VHRRTAILSSRLVATLSLALTAVSGSAQETDVAKLTNDLKSTDPAVSRDACHALNRCGERCRGAIPALEERFKRGDASAQVDAATALNGIIADVEASGMMAAMVKGLAKQPAEEAGRAAKQPDCHTVAPMVSAELGKPPTKSDPNEAGDVLMLRMFSAKLLGLCGGPAEVSSLVPLLKDPSAATRREAANALWQIGPSAKEAVPALQVLLKDPDETVRQIAQAALKKIGTK
jgi:HEAT repeat protein